MPELIAKTSAAIAVDEDLTVLLDWVNIEAVSGHTLDDLASRFRSKSQIQGRIEFATLAISRFGFRVCDVAALINKHGNFVTPQRR